MRSLKGRGRYHRRGPDQRAGRRAEIAERVWKVEVVDSGLVFDRVPERKKVKPGGEVPATLGFTHFGASTLRGVDVSVRVAHGSFVKEFSNCQYGTWPVTLYSDPQQPTDMTHQAAVCHFDDTIEVGDSFDFSLGPIRADDDARVGGASVSVSSRLTIRRDELTDVRRGNGPELELVPRPEARRRASRRRAASMWWASTWTAPPMSRPSVPGPRPGPATW
ncbi:hypothetical protein DN402_34140 [Streptomyces sp. SW4]|nr:hypothetical protein DN402_34140 [Streptomyces sp. SW4]